MLNLLKDISRSLYRFLIINLRALAFYLLQASSLIFLFFLCKKIYNQKQWMIFNSFIDLCNQIPFFGKNELLNLNEAIGSDFLNKKNFWLMQNAFMAFFSLFLIKTLIQFYFENTCLKQNFNSCDHNKNLPKKKSLISFFIFIPLAVIFASFLSFLFSIPCYFFQDTLNNNKYLIFLEICFIGFVFIIDSLSTLYAVLPKNNNFYCEWFEYYPGPFESCIIDGSKFVFEKLGFISHDASKV